MFPKVVQVVPMNDTLAWDISGNWDNSTCLDIDPDTLYDLPYAKEAIAQHRSTTRLAGKPCRRYGVKNL